MKTLFLVLVLAGSVNGSEHLRRYANNAILNAAEHGHKRVTLNLRSTPIEQVEELANDLRARGYVLDEQSALLNPQIIKVLRLRTRKAA